MKTNLKKSVIAMTAITGFTMLSMFSTATMAGGGGAFLGGMIASRVLTNMHDRTQAEEYAAYSKPQQTTVVQAAPAQSSSQSTESKLKELDSLASKGYITPAEYKSRRKAIVDAI